MENLSRLDKHVNKHRDAISGKKHYIPSNQGYIKLDNFNCFNQSENWLDKYMSKITIIEWFYGVFPQIVMKINRIIVNVIH